MLYFFLEIWAEMCTGKHLLFCAPLSETSSGIDIHVSSHKFVSSEFKMWQQCAWGICIDRVAERIRHKEKLSCEVWYSVSWYLYNEYSYAGNCIWTHDLCFLLDLQALISKNWSALKEKSLASIFLKEEFLLYIGAEGVKSSTKGLL